jgi:hypothetical protein
VRNFIRIATVVAQGPSSFKAMQKKLPFDAIIRTEAIPKANQHYSSQGRNMLEYSQPNAVFLHPIPEHL